MTSVPRVSWLPSWNRPSLLVLAWASCLGSPALAAQRVTVEFASGPPPAWTCPSIRTPERCCANPSVLAAATAPNATSAPNQIVLAMLMVRSLHSGRRAPRKGRATTAGVGSWAPAALAARSFHRQIESAGRRENRSRPGSPAASRCDRDDRPSPATPGPRHPPCSSPCRWMSKTSFEREDALPVVLHADHRPVLLLRLLVERGREGADLAVGQALRRPVGVFAGGVVVQHQHLEPRAGAGAAPFQHLAVAGRVAERRDRPTADHQVNAFRLAGLVVVE